ncbi:hypothetical protein BLA24_19855 [Streptomyces cinnamoneus]|uniref:Lipoprotein n=1 Tax=Streptomyces cinnamoneus TaxID=53446 RepID=A0A2G1XF76_STRCJ|nr:hypothetical protein [Streptomyces cinnamoneus]PHQ49892.1 hypothetical protein BLA24_19855 [Streptomyces cinnamoneus]PPT13332.1 hypothetical protein CYQ11_10935 [Streptomyces cinnamoneus]
MKTTRRFVSALALVAAVGGLAACGPEDDKAGGSSASSPAAKQTDGGGSGDQGGGDCGQPPKLPAGHKMVEIAVPPSKGSMSAKDAKPTCTPNDWIYHGQGEAKYYTFTAGEVKAELATGSGSTKTVPVGELWMHAGDCMTDTSAVKSPYSCSGNIYDITLDGEGKVKTIKEIWHP